MRRFLISALSLILLIALPTSCGKAPSSGDGSALKGYLALAEGRNEAAVQALETAIQNGLSEQKIEEAYTCLGNAYNELGQFEKSIAAHKKALEQDPKYHKAWVNLGIVYRLTDQFDEAEKCYAKALELQPDYAELHASMGGLYILQGKYDQAVQHLEKAATLDTQLAIARSNLALAYASVGRFPEADAALKRAVVLGYKNGPLIQARIDGLKALAGAGNKNANSIGSEHP